LKKGNGIKFILIILLFLAGVLASLFLGGTGEMNEYIFSAIRIPKTITAIIAGCTLSIAGLILQVIFRNPLAGPYVLGISSGASLLVALTIIGTQSIFLIEGYYASKGLILLSSLIGSMAVTGLILLLSKRIGSNVILLLIGLMIAQICGALQGALEYFADPGKLKSFVMWSMGSLAGTTLKDSFLLAALGFAFITLTFFYIKPLQAFLAGQNYSESSGIDYKKNRFALIFISSALTGITTAFCGPIAFVGISVPLLSRIIFKTSDQLTQIVSSILLGAILLLFSDMACHVFSQYTLPVNMITTIIGAPFVIYLLFKNRQL